MKTFNRKEIFNAVDKSNKRISTMSKQERQKLRDETKKTKQTKYYCEWCYKEYNPKNPETRYKFCSRNCYYDHMGSDAVYDGGGNTY